MRKIILTGAVLAMLTSAAPMVHAQIDQDVQQALDKKVNQDKYDAEIKKLEGKVGKVDSLDEKINNIQKDLDGRIAANEKLLNGDNGNDGLKKSIEDLKKIVGENDKEGLRKDIYDVKTDNKIHKDVIKYNREALEGADGKGGLKKDFGDLKKVVGENENEGLQKDVKENKKLLVGDDGNGGLQKDVGGLKKSVEDLKTVVGKDETEGLQKAVKENANNITQVDRKASKALTDIDELKAKRNDIAKDIAELGGRINVTGAMSAALAGLKPLQYDPMAPTQVMGSVSTYEGQQAYALGLAHFTSEDLMVHGGVSFTNSHKYMANVGVTYKFGHSAEKSMIPMRYQAGPISSIYVMQKENEMMREKMAQQEERIAQLEEMIMNMKK